MKYSLVINLKCNVSMNHKHSQTDKTVKLKRFGEPKGRPGGGEAQGFWLFLYIDRKVRGNGGFFLGETCQPLVVRGTTSFTIINYKVCLLEKVSCGMFECD